MGTAETHTHSAEREKERNTQCIRLSLVHDRDPVAGRNTEILLSCSQPSLQTVDTRHCEHKLGTIATNLWEEGSSQTFNNLSCAHLPAIDDGSTVKMNKHSVSPRVDYQMVHLKPEGERGPT